MTDPTDAVIYCRVSTSKQASNGHGLESQEARCRDYAAEKGYEVACVFPDDISGGGDFMKRPGMVALLSFLDAQPEKDFVVIFDDLKRFARDAEFHRALRRALDIRGARPECLNFRFEDSPEGEFIETVIAAQGELERKQMRRQTIQKMQARTRAGYWLFNPLTGYRFANVEGHGRMLVRDDPLATIIEEALEGFASGRLATIAEVKRFLESHAIFPRDKNGEVKFDKAKRILEHPIYAGYLSVPKWDIHMLQGKHEPLIDFTSWQRIQGKLAGQPIAPTRKTSDNRFPLRGFIACACCDRPMTGSLAKGRSKHYPYYFCNNQACDEYRGNIRAEALESAFEGLLRRLRPLPEVVHAFEAILREVWDEDGIRAEDEATEAKRAVKRIDSQIEQLVDQVLATDSTALKRTYESRIRKLDTERIRLEELSRRHTRPRATFEETVRTGIDFLLNPWKLWASRDLAHQNLLLRLVFATPLAYCRKQGIRTANLTLPFKALAGSSDTNSRMVRPTGLEPVFPP